MRMWGVNPKLMCRRHLLGEHVEMHMFKGCLDKGKSIKGYIDTGLVYTPLIGARHDELAQEMTKRGYSHKSKMEPFNVISAGYINRKTNLQELARRCPDCKNRIKNKGGEK